MISDYENEWIYEGKKFTGEMICDNIGFVYIITNIHNGKRYIGKKNFFSNRTLPPLKGKKRKRKKKIESNWKDYYGSSEELKLLVENDKKHFNREILHLCKSKGEMSYIEMKEQITRDVLLKPEEYYNSFVGGKIHRNHLNRLIEESQYAKKENNA